jgi:hypothetical protein
MTSSNARNRVIRHGVIALATLALTSLANDAAACSCSDTDSVCTSFNGAPAVFIGLVESVTEEKAEVLRFGRKETVRVGLTAHFRVEEPLKGLSSATVDVVTGGSDADCGFPFVSGRRYLVYGYQTEAAALGSALSRTVIGPAPRTPPTGALRATICGRTRELSQAQDDVDLLRALRAGKPETRIFGSVARMARPPDVDEFLIKYLGPMAGVSVRAEGAGRSFTTSTDANGRYRFAAPAGTYTVTLQPPPGYGPLFDPADVASRVTVTERGCSAEHDFSLHLDGRVSGRVFDSSGRPVADQVKVSIVTRASAAKGLFGAERRSDYTKDGRYDIDGLPPGQYVIGVNIVDAPAGHSPYPTMYYPRAAELKDATTITLGEGQRLANIDLHLPAGLPPAVISGVVIGRDGSPAANANVVLHDGASGQSLFGLEAKTDASGRFSIQAFLGRDYLVRAYVVENYLAGTGTQSKPIRVRTAGSTVELRIVLNQNGIF